MKTIIYMRNGQRKEFTEVSHAWGSAGDLILLDYAKNEIGRFFLAEVQSYEIYLYTTRG